MTRTEAIRHAIRLPMRAIALALCLVGATVAVAAGVAATARPINVDPEHLKPGEFAWYPEASPRGPLLLVVSLVEQRAFLYRNGVRIAVTTVSSGKEGNETPTGVFTILQKRKEHYSNLYNSAPMPFMQRLTWDGIALHAGKLPGYAASHGCVRLPTEFARRLFETTEMGMTVVVADDSPAAPGLAHPGWLAPPVPGAAPLPKAVLPIVGEDYYWKPELALEGPLSLLLSTADGNVRVVRNGIEIGHAHVSFDGAPPAGTQVLQLRAGTLEEESKFVAGRPRMDWTRVQLGVAEPGAGVEELYDSMHVSPEFARHVYDILVPGTTLVITDSPATPTTAGEPILDAEAPDAN